MAEKPRSWTPQLIQGGISDTPKKESKQKPERSLEAARDPEPEPAESKHLIRPEELAFSLDGGGWRQTGGGNDTGGRSEISKEGDLVRLYLDLSGKPPANFEALVRADRKQEAAAQVRSWTVDSLHKYLSRADVWSRPSYTKAIFEEIRERMLRGKMSPRE
jgi:hypothetical protein